MLKYKTVTIPARTDERLDAMTCDLCGARAPRDPLSWRTGEYETLETTVEIAEGTSYPDGGSKKTTAFHLCPKCFREKLIPWLASQGAKPTETETDW